MSRLLLGARTSSSALSAQREFGWHEMFFRKYLTKVKSKGEQLAPTD